MEASDLLHVEGIILTTKPVQSLNLMASNAEPPSQVVETVDQSQTASESVHFALATHKHTLTRIQIYTEPTTT